jgi:RimJ/RimL family protein N-acetyltransferase
MGTVDDARTLRDGSEVRLRAIAADDDERLIAFHEKLSPETQRLRFFGPHPHLSIPEVQRFVRVDGDRRVAIVAERDDEIVAVARYDLLGDTGEAEAAFVVRDDLQGCGLGTVLLAELAARARANGVARLVALTLPENRRMQRVLHAYGPNVSSAFVDGVVRFEIALTDG